MVHSLTEDEVRTKAGHILGLDKDIENVKNSTGQLTTFNNLGFTGVPNSVEPKKVRHFKKS